MAAGIWGMHFTAMLEMAGWLDIHYDTQMTLISLIPAITGCSLTLVLLARDERPGWTLAGSSLALALGVGTMHYVGMEAMRGAFVMRYDPLSFAYSIGLAWVVAALSIGTYQRLERDPKQRLTGVVLGAIGLAAAVTTMHMAGMDATQFYTTDEVIPVENSWLAPEGMTIIIVCVVTMVTGSLIVTELLHFRFVVSLQNLRASEERRQKDHKMHAAIVSHLTDGLLLADLQGDIKLSNLKAEEIFGCSSEDLSKINLAELFDAPCIKIFRDELARDASPTRALESIESQKEIRNRRGENFWLHSVIVPVWEGEKWLLSANLRDVTDTLARDRELERIGAAIDCAQDCFSIADMDEKLVYVNKAFETRYKWSKEEALGARTRDHLERLNTDEMRDGLLSSGTWAGRTSCRLKDGSVLEEFGSMAMIPDENGLSAFFVTIIRDYSEQLTLERKLGQSQKLESIGQLAAGIAHEINTPTQYVGDNTRFTKDAFSDIQSLIKDLNQVAEEDDQISKTKYAELLEKADMDYVLDEVPKALEQSIEGIERVSEIVRAMKSFSHPENDKVMLDLNSAIQSTITVASNEWKYVASMETDFDQTLAAVPCFPGPFNQVILNILVNASHAIADTLTEENSLGLIKVSTMSVRDVAEIRIADSGDGMPDHVKEKIFDPFFTTKEVGKGTGQGLSIAHDVIVNKHGGSIEVESEPGQGTTFVIRLPQSGETVVAADATDAAVAIEPDTTSAGF